MRKFKPLCRVHCHHAHTRAVLLRIGIGKKRYTRKVALKRCFLTAGSLELIDRLLELGKVIQPVLRAFCAEHGFIAALVEHIAQKLGYGRFRAARAEALHKIHKFTRLR